MSSDKNTLTTPHNSPLQTIHEDLTGTSSQDPNSYPPPPTSTIEALTQQLRQLQIAISEQSTALKQIQSQQGSSQGSNPGPEETRNRPTNDTQVIPDEEQELDIRNNNALKQLSERAKTLASLNANAPKFDGSGDLLLWKKRIMEYLRRRGVTEARMAIDVLQESCEKTAQEYLGALEWPVETIDQFWVNMEARFSRDAFSRMADYDALRQRPGQTYQQYADVLTQKSYGLNIPREAQLRKFLSTMLHGQELRRFVLPNIDMYLDVRALGNAVERLTQEDSRWSDGKQSSKCRICGKAGHFAAACPKNKNKAAAPKVSLAYPVAEAEPYEAYSWENYEECEELEDYEDDAELNQAKLDVEPAEKRPADPPDLQQQLKKLRGPGRPARFQQKQEGPGLSTHQKLANKQQMDRPGLVTVPLRGYKPTVTNSSRPLVPASRFSTVKTPTQAPRSLRKAVSGFVDVPAHILMGLVLKASGKPEELARSWMKMVEQDAQSLLGTSPITDEIMVDTLELEQLDTSAVLNPISKEESQQRKVGYMPIKFESCNHLFWGLVDTGAQVSVISAGLANYLDLYAPDMSNVHPANFAVRGYNGAKSYMPILQTAMRLGARGGDERHIGVHFCVLDTNSYKLLIGMDLLQELQFIMDGSQKRLHLQNAGVRFSLPLADREYAYRSTGIQEYHKALHELPPEADNVEISVTKLDNEISEGMEATYENTLSFGCADYISSNQKDSKEGLMPLLYLAELTNQSEVQELERPQNQLATLTPKLASHCLRETIEAGRRLWIETDDQSWPYFQVTNSPVANKMHFCHPEEPIMGGVEVDLSVLSTQDPASNLEYLQQLALQTYKQEEVLNIRELNPLHLITGPMYSGKTTKLLQKIEELDSKGQKLKLIKHNKDVRYGMSQVRTHDFNKEKLADISVELLQKVDVSKVDGVAIEELHFFADAVPILKQWQGQGKQIYATTLSTGWTGERMPVLVDLQAAKLPIEEECLQANCDVCGTKNSAVFSARITPLHETPVGGKADYLACCTQCFTQTSVFTNPKALLADPTFYDTHKAEVLATIEGNEQLLCQAIQAAIVTLEGGLMPTSIRCPMCAHLHLDESPYASKEHYTHLCEVCKNKWESNCPNPSNPLARFELQLHEGKLLIKGLPSKPNEELLMLPEANYISTTQFMAASVQSMLPQQQEAGGMGTADLPAATPKNVLTEEQLQQFMTEYQLLPTGDPATLHLRAAKLETAIKQNEALIDPARSKQEKVQAYQMLLDVADVFATSLDDLVEPAKGETFKIDTGDNYPIKQRPYKMGKADTEFLNKTILGQLKCGIVRQSKSPWSSPAFVARARPYGSVQKPKERKVIDYRKLNRVTRTDTHPLPDIPELLEWLSQYHFVGAIDLKSGYWQKETDPQDACKTAFVTPNALHEYTRVPFGVKNAPAFFQREINTLLRDNEVTHSRGFVDDLLTGGETWESYLKNQSQLFSVLRDNKWLVTISKVRLGYEEMSTLGHVVGQGYIKPDPEKVACIRRLTPPTNVTGVRAFLGLVGYYRKYIPGFAKIAKPLTSLTSPDVKFDWGNAQQTAFGQLQHQLSKATMLHTPQSEGKFRLYTDYSSDALAAALHQIQDGVERPIAFASRLCKGPEGSLSSAEGELCALVYALAKFRNYLGFTEFDVITDSSALTSLRSNQNLSSKLTRWSVLLSEFNFTIIHKPGASHKNVDGLSRSSQEDQLGVTNYLHVWAMSQDAEFLMDDVYTCIGPSKQVDENVCQAAVGELNASRKLQGGPCLVCQNPPKDRMLLCGRCGASQHAACTPRRPAPCYWYCPSCTQIISQRGGPSDITEDVDLQRYLLGGQRPLHLTTEEGQKLQQSYMMKRGQLLVETTFGLRVYPTSFERSMLIEEYHNSLMHAGWRATAEALKDKYYWPGMEAETKAFCQNCLACQLQTAIFRRTDHLGGHLTAAMPRVAWSLDCAPSIATKTGDRASILIAVDDFTRYVLCIILPKLDSRTVRNAFVERILTVYGRPQRVRTDQGKEFEGEFTSLLQTLQVDHIKTRPIAPWTNGRAERMVRQVKSLMKRTLYSHPQANWIEVVPWVTGAINAVVSRTTGFSPHEVFFGEPPQPIIPSISNAPVPFSFGEESKGEVEAYVRQIKQKLTRIYSSARANQQRYETGLEEDYDQYPVTAGQHAGGMQMGRKSGQPSYYRGQLVVVKQSKGAAGPSAGHFALGATGPHVVLRDSGNSIQVQAPNGRIKWQSKANCVPLKSAGNL